MPVDPIPSDKGFPHYQQTGWRTCHGVRGELLDCAHSGQDAELRPGAEPPEPRFLPDNDSVRDALTRLTWTRSANPAGFPLTWHEALDFVDSCNTEALAGHTDWRLPNRRELRSLIDYSRKDPAVSAGHPFADLAPQWYWSSTPWAGNPEYAWYVHFVGGRMFYGKTDGYYLVWPVRGTSNLLPEPQAGPETSGIGWTAGRFEPDADSVLDTLTGLRWTRDADLFGPLNWSEALDKARSLNDQSLGGQRNWRLPTINELESLTDASQHGPALPLGHPFRNVRQVYHSSTTSGYEHDWLMALYMDKGAVGVGYKPDAAFQAWYVCSTL